MVLDAQEMEILMKDQRILVIQTAFIGDSILTLPMIQRLKQLRSDATIDVVCHPLSAGIFKSSPSVGQVIVFDKRGKDKGLLNLFRFAGFIRKRKYDKIYSPHRSARTSLLVRLSGVRETYGFSNSSLSRFYNHIIEYRSDLHEVHRNLLLIGFPVEGDSWRILPEISISNETETKINDFISKFKAERFAAIAPGSVWQTKKYPKEKYVKIIRYLLDNSFNIFLLGGQTDEHYCDEIAGMFDQRVINTAGKFSITESIGLLKKCSILISNDSAPTHFAMCANIPVLTIYCSTVAEFGFYPYNASGKYISYDKLSCKPCGIHGHQKCPVKTFDCAYKLEMDRVLGMIEQMISK